MKMDRSYYKTSGKSKHQKWASSPCILFSCLEGTPSLLYKIKSNLGLMAMSDKRKMATNVLFFSQRKKNKILLLDMSVVFFISFKGPYEKKMLKFWESKNRSLWISNFWIHKVTIFISPQLSKNTGNSIPVFEQNLELCASSKIDTSSLDALGSKHSKFEIVGCQTAPGQKLL